MAKKTSVKRKVPRSTTPDYRKMSWRKVLDIVDQRLSVGDEGAEYLWHVLTAFRGPDDGRDELKAVTTAVIRRQALPKAAETLAGQGWYVARPTTQYGGSRNTFDHFESHAYRAAAALELI